MQDTECNAHVEIDTPMEHLRPRQLAELGTRLYEVLENTGHRHEELLAPAPPHTLNELASVDKLTPSQQDLLAPLAAWITEHRERLVQAYPGPTPPFDHLQDFWSNFYEGPRNGEPFPDVPPVRDSTKLLGFELNFPFGVPSCAVTPQSDYIKFFAARGFDLLTYKTVRDRAWNPFFFPNWGFAPHITSPLQPETLADPISATLDLGVVTDLSTTSLVNSFGVPSLAPPMWKADIHESKASLKPGQVLVVSVVGSPEAEDTKSEADLIRQFVTAAADAQEAGADIIEVNLSCPNTPGRNCSFRSSFRGPVCTSPDLSFHILAAIKRQVKSSTPIFVKIAYMNDLGLADFVAKCQTVVDGIVGINAYPVHTRDPSGGAFFPSRVDDIAGLSGVGIRELGLKVTRQLCKLRQSHGATNDDWVIVGVGGVMTPTDYTAYRESGADAVQSCSGSWLDHFLAVKIRQHVLGEAFTMKVRPRDSRRAFVRGLVEAIETGGVSLLTSHKK